MSSAGLVMLPDAGPLTSGNYQPSNYGSPDPFADPAPPPPYGSNLSVFNGTSPTGTWNLYVYDDNPINVGSIAGGWRLEIVLASPPIITQHPTSQIVAPGFDVAFNVTVSGTPPFAYQWLRNGQVLVPFGLGTASLAIGTVQASDAGIYAVVVTNSANPNPGVTSSNAILNVLGPLQLVAQPQPQTLLPGANVTFYVAAAGTPPISYQWRLNGAILAGETAPTLTLSNVQPINGGSFDVLVSTATQAIGSNPAKLIVGDFPFPATDLFNTRETLPTLEDGIIQASSATATNEPGEPLPRGGGKSIWYQWTPPYPGIVTFTTRGSTFDTLLSVYTGNALTNLTLVTRDDDKGGFYTSSVRFNATPNQRYQIALDGFGLIGSGDDFTLSWMLEETDELTPVFLADPVSQAVEPGSNAVFSVTTDSPLNRYQWFRNGTFLPGATNSAFTVMAQSEHVGWYTVLVKNSFGRELMSAPADLQLSLEAVLVHDKYENMFLPPPVAPQSGMGATVSHPMSISIINNRPAAGFHSIGLGGSVVTNEFYAPTNSQPGAPKPCDTVLLGTRYLRLEATNNGVMQVHSIGSPLLARIAVYKITGSTADFSAPAFRCDLTNALNSKPALMTFPAQKDSNYCVVAQGWPVNVPGNVKLTARMGVAPPISANPQCVHVPLGGTHSLTMPAANWIPVPECQWRFNGQDLPGATNITLFVTNFHPLIAGAYSVVMSNFVSMATSLVAQLNQAGDPRLGYIFRTNSGNEAFILVGSADQPFAIESASTFEARWAPVATNENACATLRYTNFNVLVDPNRFFRAVRWFP